jgi:putative membrane protein
MSKIDQHINKDLILREKLAIERTRMANDRTLLSFIRTALYFIVAGLSINSLLELRYGAAIQMAFLIIAAIVMVVGLLRFLKMRKKLNLSYRHVGNFKSDWEEEL